MSIITGEYIKGYPFPVADVESIFEEDNEFLIQRVDKASEGCGLWRKAIELAREKGLVMAEFCSREGECEGAECAILEDANSQLALLVVIK